MMGTANMDQDTLFTQDGCDESPLVRTWLIEHDIRFGERNIRGDEAGAEALAAAGTFATPLLVVGKRRVLSYQPDALRAAIEAEGTLR